jgi:predicted dehydrogenase
MVPAFQANDITPKALFDTDQERFQFWRNHDLDLLTTDLDELLGSDVDAVYISSRNDQHAAHAMAAARAGKHILVEKPMALTLADARTIVAAADEAGVQLAVNHHLPGSPLHATARQLVADDRIGTLLLQHGSTMPCYCPRTYANGGSPTFREAASFSTSLSTTRPYSIPCSALRRHVSPHLECPKRPGTKPGHATRS